MISVSGKIVHIKEEKTEKGQRYKRLQLFSDGNGRMASLENVTDMSNGEWVHGADVVLPVSLQTYQGKKGIGYSLTHWGGGVKVPSASDAGLKGKV
jgi:hypothetical protein